MECGLPRPLPKDTNFNDKFLIKHTKDSNEMRPPSSITFEIESLIEKNHKEYNEMWAPHP
jgi:hypothetical protein